MTLAAIDPSPQTAAAIWDKSLQARLGINSVSNLRRLRSISLDVIDRRTGKNLYQGRIKRSEYTYNLANELLTLKNYALTGGGPKPPKEFNEASLQTQDLRLKTKDQRPKTKDWRFRPLVFSLQSLVYSRRRSSIRFIKPPLYLYL